MGKYFSYDDICEMIDSKLDKKARAIVMDSSLNGEYLQNAVNEFRALKASLYSFADDLKEADEAYEAEMATWKTNQEVKK